MDINDRIFLIMERKNISGYKLSKDLNIPASAISYWRSKKQVPKSDTVTKLAEYFGVSTDYLLTGKEFNVGMSEADRIYQKLNFTQKKQAIDYLTQLEQGQPVSGKYPEFEHLLDKLTKEQRETFLNLIKNQVHVNENIFEEKSNKKHKL